jgi:hypothetical protein
MISDCADFGAALSSAAPTISPRNGGQMRMGKSDSHFAATSEKCIKQPLFQGEEKSIA